MTYVVVREGVTKIEVKASKIILDRRCFGPFLAIQVAVTSKKYVEEDDSL